MNIPTLDDYNLAIQQKLEGLKIIGDNNIIKDVPAYYGNPESEFKIKEVPAIVFYSSEMVVDTSRWTNDRLITDIEKDEENNPDSILELNHPEPFNIIYFFRYYFKYQEDGNIILAHILNRFPRVSYLEINNDKYDIFYEGQADPMVGYKNFGEQSEKREFVKQVQYKLEALLEVDNLGVRKKVAKEVPRLNVFKRGDV